MEQSGRKGDKRRLGAGGGEEARTARVWMENGLSSPVRQQVSEEHNTTVCTKDVTVNRLKYEYLNTMGPDTYFSGGWPEWALSAGIPDTATVFLPHDFSMKEE